MVFAAGFAEAGARALQEELRAAAAGACPLFGPTATVSLAFHAGAALWGDALQPRPAGRVALISQSGNVAVNALAVGRGLRYHTVASVGNQAVIAAADLLAALIEEDEVGSVALFLESDGDGAALAGALARPAERRIGIAVLKVGATRRGRLPPRPTPAPWPATRGCSARSSRRRAGPGPRTCTTCWSWPRRSRCRGAAGAGRRRSARPPGWRC